jgi:hypothetical protein
MGGYFVIYTQMARRFFFSSYTCICSEVSITGPISIQGIMCDLLV